MTEFISIFILFSSLLSIIHKILELIFIFKSSNFKLVFKFLNMSYLLIDTIIFNLIDTINLHNFHIKSINKRMYEDISIKEYMKIHQ